MNQMFFSDKQIAKRYGVTRTTVWRWVRHNKFPPPVKISKGCSRWPIEKVKEYERKRAEVSR
jgi:predicted DNA-binding transcriptional regulator AlpA